MRAAPKRARGNGGVVAGVAVLAAAFFSIPFAAHYAKVRGPSLPPHSLLPPHSVL